MKKITFFNFIFFFFTSALIHAQEAKIQFIHNAPDLSIQQIDVYINGELFLDDFAFRKATPFITVNAQEDLRIDVAYANSSSSTSSFYNVTVNLPEQSNYIAIASGIVSTAGYSVASNFSIEFFEDARETSLSGFATDVLICHNSTDAPTVDIVETIVPSGTIVNNLSYSQFSEYLELTNFDYVLDVRDQLGNVLASYSAPLEALGLNNVAITILASGFLNPSSNSNGPGFGLWVATPEGGDLIELQKTKARAQIIHNSPDLSVSLVDVYVNGALTIDDFAFRTATGFLDFPSGIQTNIVVKPSNSNGNLASPILYSLSTTLLPFETYVMVVNGIKSSTGYSTPPNFAISLFPQGRTAATQGDLIEVLVNNGTTDSQAISIVETQQSVGPIISDLLYSEFNDYVELLVSDYTFDVRNQSGSLVGTFLAPFQTLELDGQAITVLASGFLTPSQNSNGPAFGLWMAKSTGGPLIPLQEVDVPTAKIQLIHNSADFAITSVDVYINGELRFNDFDFRTSTQFIVVPAEVDLTFTIAPSDSVSAVNPLFETIFNLIENRSYVGVLDGIISDSGYMPRQPFDVKLRGVAREIANISTNTDILSYNGCTDSPIIDVIETQVPLGRIVNNIEYTEFIGYTQLQTSNFVFVVKDELGTDTIATFSAPFLSLGLQGKAVTLLTSGFLDPLVNSNGENFSLWVATGQGGDLIELPNALPLSTNETLSVEKVKVYPNPAKGILTIQIPISFSKAQARLFDLNGREVLSKLHNINTIDVSKLADGIYMMNLEIDNVIINKKIMVKN